LILNATSCEQLAALIAALEAPSRTTDTTEPKSISA